MPKISITQLRRFGHSGWQWVEKYTYPYDDAPTERTCRTNQNGAGLFHYDPIRSYWHQQQGTCQFWLPKGKDAAYSKIRRRIEKEELTY